MKPPFINTVKAKSAHVGFSATKPASCRKPGRGGSKGDKSSSQPRPQFSFRNDGHSPAVWPAGPTPTQLAPVLAVASLCCRVLSAGAAVRGDRAGGLPSGGPHSVLNIHRHRYFLKGEPTARESSQPRGRTKGRSPLQPDPKAGERQTLPVQCPLGRTLERGLRDRITLASSLFLEVMKGVMMDLVKERKLAP